MSAPQTKAALQALAELGARESAAKTFEAFLDELWATRPPIIVRCPGLGCGYAAGLDPRAKPDALAVLCTHCRARYEGGIVLIDGTRVRVWRKGPWA